MCHQTWLIVGCACEIQNHAAIGVYVQIEIKYFETLQYLRDRRWRVETPAVKAIDALIGAIGPVYPTSTNVAVQAERRTGLAH